MPLLLWAVVIILLAVVAALAFAGGGPRPQQETNELEVPTTEIGTPIGVLFGRRRIKQLSVVWYGDVAIKKVKVDAGGKK